MKCRQVWCAVVVFCAVPFVAAAGTRFVAETGTDGPNCGVVATTACRSISQAIALASVGDTILVGPGRYGDLNLNGILGDLPGEETGSPGCSCVLSMNKNVIILSSAGAATTIIDGTGTQVAQTVVVLSNGGEFGRPGKGFTVTPTMRFDAGLKKFTGHGIGIDAANVKVRGNQVVFIGSAGAPTTGTGIFTVNDAAILIEGNRVLNWQIGIEVRVASAATVSGNEVINNLTGIDARGGNVVRNVATGNRDGFWLRGATKVENNSASKNLGGFGFLVLAGFSGTLTKNNMFSNAHRGLLGCGVYNDHVVGLNATNNYWGSGDGPGSPPAEQSCGSGMTETAPFATRPFKVTILKP